MKYKLEITLQGLPKNTNGSHGHWTKSYGERKKWRRAVFFKAIANKPLHPLNKCKITCIRFSSVEPDHDNLVISFKSVIDGLKDAEVIEDDKSSCVLERLYRWEKAKPGKGYITVIVEEL